MQEHSSRRRFLQSAIAGTSIAHSGLVIASETQPLLSQTAVEDEIHRRADWHRSQHHLAVDYYRIRRKLAYPLPARSLAIPNMPVPSIEDYPWAIWMLWALEERIYSLAWAAEWKQDEQLASLASRDLLA
ncbi:MAG: hypothetical protein NTY38_26925, partial [Acidobacteria bacterium]|nr:hypothetical protein [Acidobacteriota bacterium]